MPKTINNVNHKNMIVMWNFLQGLAAEGKIPQDEINIFKSLPFPDKEYENALKYYTDPTQWSPLERYVQCYLKTKEVSGDRDAFRNCGRSAAKYKSFSEWRNIARSVPGPAHAINNLPKVIKAWNDTKLLELVEPAHYSITDKKVVAIIKYTFHQHINPVDDYCSDPHILGLFESIPTNYPSLGLGKVHQPLVQYDPVKLYGSIFFEHLNLEPEFGGLKLFLRDPETGTHVEVGEKVILLPSNHPKGLVYLGEYKGVEQEIKEDDYVATLLTKTLRYKGEPITEEGLIMGAPYFIINFSCKELMVRKLFWNLRSLFRGKADLLEEVYNKHEHLKEQIEQKNFAYQELLRHKHYLEEMVEERTAQYKEQRDLAEEKTQELRDTQAKLVESEKRVLEHRITGGFAHEMRNALTGAQLEMKAVLDYQEKGKAATEVIKEAATNLLQTIKTLQAEYQIPKDQIAQTLIPSIREIAQVIEFLAGTHQDVYHDLERGLSITSQIRDYAKMAELRPGNEPVDLAALLKGYETRYAKDFGEKKIHYFVSGPDTLILRGDETHFNSIFSNLILNARDALMEMEKEDKQIQISVETLEKEGKSLVQIRVRDNGPGIPEEHLSEIFEPFFSTKPSSGTGLGLGIVRRLVQLYGGQIDVKSNVGQGTTFIVTVPLSPEDIFSYKKERASEAKQLEEH